MKFCACASASGVPMSRNAPLVTATCNRVPSRTAAGKTSRSKLRRRTRPRERTNLSRNR